MTEWTELQTMFSSEDEEERVEALRQLPAGDTDAALRLILQALGDPSWRVRKQAVELYLLRTDAEQSATQVISLLYSPDNAGLRNAAVEILIRLGSAVADKLIIETRSDDHDVRKFAIDILGGISEIQCVPALIEALNDPDENVRAAAAENLGKIGSEDAVPALLSAMERADLLSRFTILEAIGRIGRPVAIEELLPYKDDLLLRKPLYECLGKVGDDSALVTLAEGVVSGPVNVSESAILSLQLLVERNDVSLDERLSPDDSSKLADSLCVFFESNKKSIRRAAINLFGSLRDSSKAEQLLGLLSDEELQDSAFKALMALGEDGAAKLASVWEHVDPGKQAYIAYLFGETAYRKGLPLLRDAILSPDPQLRAVASGALGKVGDSGSLTRLAELFPDEVKQVREAATKAVVSLGGAYTAEALTVIRPYLEHAVPEARMAAVSALGGVGGADALDALQVSLKDVSPQVRQAAIRAFAPSGGETTIGAMSLALMDEDPAVRRLAAEKLGMCSDSSGIPPLELALADEDIWVRSAAVRALGRVGGEPELPKIERLLFDPVGLVSIAVLDTVAEVDRGRVGELYGQALDHQDPEVVIVALQGLVRQKNKELVTAKSWTLSEHRSVEVRTALYRAVADLLAGQALPVLATCLEREQDVVALEQLREIVDQLKALHG